MPPETFADIAPFLLQAGITLTLRQAGVLQDYAVLLERWNRRINLAGDRERVFSRHLLDCLMLEKQPGPVGAAEALDIGSGAGLPGLVVAALHPQWRVTSLEKAAKKVSFQQVARAELGLENFFPLRGDVHQLLEPQRGRYDLVMARAFASLEVLVGLAGALLRPGGSLWAMKGRRLGEEQAVLTPELLEPFDPGPRVFGYDFPELGLGGVVAVYRKKEGGTES